MLCLIVLTLYNEQRGRRMIVLLPLGLYYWECVMWGGLWCEEGLANPEGSRGRLRWKGDGSAIASSRGLAW